MAAERTKCDWERVELQYRAGMLTLREMGTANGVAESAIRKRAKRDGWTRDLAAKVRAKADELVRKSEVRKEVRTEGRISEQREIAIGAEVVAQVKLAQRADIGKARTLCMAMLVELEGQTVDRELFQRVGELLASPNPATGADQIIPDKLVEMYQAVIGLPERTKTMKALAETLHKLIGLEREAFNIQPGEATGAGGTGPQFIIMPVQPAHA